MYIKHWELTFYKVSKVAIIKRSRNLLQYFQLLLRNTLYILFVYLFLPLCSWEREESVARNFYFLPFNGYINDIDLFWSYGLTEWVRCYFPSTALYLKTLNSIESYALTAPTDRKPQLPHNSPKDWVWKDLQN